MDYLHLQMFNAMKGSRLSTISLLLVLLSSDYSSTTTVQALTTPSFPKFSNSIAGRYYIPGGGAESVEVVDGAVLLDNGIELSSRDDEGFCFFDCGSYSFGPINLHADDDEAFMASLSVPGSRVYVEGDVDEEGYLDGNLAMEYPRVLVDEEEDKEMLSDRFMLNTVSAVPSFTVSYQLTGSMSTGGWNRENLTWTAEGNELDPTKEPKGPYQLWLVNQKNIVEGGSDMCIGIACATTGYVKNLVRSYDSAGQLVSASRQEGLLN